VELSRWVVSNQVAVKDPGIYSCIKRGIAADSACIQHVINQL
jgi:hypothetical protein